MQEINQKLAEEVRSVDFQKFLVCLDGAFSHSDSMTLCAFQAGLNITHICLPADSSEDEVTIATRLTPVLRSSFDLIELLASLSCGL